MYRPEGWENPYKETDSDYRSRGYKTFEAGADAMLEALKRTGYKIKAGESFGDEETGERTIVKVDGRVVFIPEEQDATQ